MQRARARTVAIGGIQGLILSAMLVIATTGPARAACHIFEVSAQPSEVTEGDSVTVTVTRDADVAESSIDVATADDTATAGVDYEPLDETADFPDGGTEQTFTVATLEVDEAKGPRTFRIELSNPQGCSVNPSFQVGDPAVVTIVDAETAEEPAPDGEEPAPDPTEESLAETGVAQPVIAFGLVALMLMGTGMLMMRRQRA